MFYTGEPLTSPDRMPELLTVFQADRDCLDRLFPSVYSPRRRERMERFLQDWREMLRGMAFADLSRSDQVDWLLFKALLETEQHRLKAAATRWDRVTEPLLPFAPDLIDLEDSRRALEWVDPEAAAQRLDDANARTKTLTEALICGTKTTTPVLAEQAARIVLQLRSSLQEWFTFYHQYDPGFDWWVTVPFLTLHDTLSAYSEFLSELVQTTVGDGIVGEPIGRDALLAELRSAQVPYEPEELIDAGHIEMDWCREELRRAAREMGYGDDWRAALEQVKTEHCAPGEQPELVRTLALEAIEYVEMHDLVTIPPIARECWRMNMMSAEQQKVNPFFLGGEQIIVSFPTREMAHTNKKMSLRGNNRAFAQATVHHELIPGHHLHMFYQQRHRPYREIFSTAFWIEGWTLHWEMLFWERSFARTPRERIGMLFWRMHRAARVIFSLKFHLGEMTAAECVEMLVDEAGHERDNARAEVRRSFEGNYEPLYQCAYLIGGWQMHALYRELVGGGKLTDRAFHDAVLQENSMPIPMLRALLHEQSLHEDFSPDWRFYPLPTPSGEWNF